jgi:hypothetical protein
LSSPRTVCLLTQTHGPVSLVMMVSELASPLLAVGFGGRAVVIFLFWLLTLTRGPTTIFSNETCFPKLLEPIKQHLKIKKIRTILIWTFSI